MKKVTISLLLLLLLCWCWGGGPLVRAADYHSVPLAADYFRDLSNWDWQGDVVVTPPDPDHALESGELHLIPTSRFPVSAVRLARFQGQPIPLPDEYSLSFEFSLGKFQTGDRFELEYRTYEDGSHDIFTCTIVAERQNDDRQTLSCRFLHRLSDGGEQGNPRLSFGLNTWITYQEGRHYGMYLQELDGYFLARLYDVEFPSQIYEWSQASGTHDLIYERTQEHPRFVLASEMVTRPNAARLNLYSFVYGDRDFALDLGVPALFQSDERWRDELLGHSQRLTIGSHGCLLTSLAMILRSYGYMSLADGQALTPATLNEWLRAQSDGYVQQTYLNIVAVTRLVHQLHQWQAGQGNQQPELEYRYLPASGVTFADASRVFAREPTIQEVTGHFVVQRGFHFVVNDQLINDPAYRTRDHLWPYYRTQSVRRLIPSYTDLSYLVINLQGQAMAFWQHESETVEGQCVPLQDQDTLQVVGHQCLLPQPPSGHYQLQVASDDPQAAYSLFAYNRWGGVVTYHPEMLRVDGRASLEFDYKAEATGEGQLLAYQDLDEWSAIIKDSRWPYAFARLTIENYYNRGQYATLPFIIDDYLARELISVELAERIKTHLAGK